ncbi:MAG TPA: glycosyltransferase family 4 protein [Blastocatellia bacterium]|nr:glycosyltransferase family 4 protein [Blastocatellia bacterium]
MRIAQVSPLYESVPPKMYGGTERIVSFLTEELVRQGHEVTLFASGDSVTGAELVACSPKSLRLDSGCIDYLAPHFVMLERAFESAHRFDIIHFHIDYLHFPLSSRLGESQVTTLHGRLDIPQLVPLYKRYPDMPVVSISNSQRAPLSWINWQGTVYHGLPDGLLTCSEKPGDYLAFLGRCSPEKRLDLAIEIARRVRMKLKVAAKVDKVDQDYFNEVLKPLIKDPCVEFIGEISEREKQEFLGNAYGLLFPIDWPEPFGLVMIEAMACGTPVIAFRRGSVPEVMEDGVTGFVVDNVEEAASAVEKLSTLDRRRCRAVFDRRFTARRMTDDYLAIYRQIIERNVTPELDMPAGSRAAIAKVASAATSYAD